MKAPNRKDTGSVEDLCRILKETGRHVLEEWDKYWHSAIHSGLVIDKEIQCEKGCADCCFSRRVCTFCEGLAVIDYMEKNLSPERQEHFRLKVESANRTFQKLRQQDYCREEAFYFAGGLECPFLDNRSCAIYPARPLSCRTQYATPLIPTDHCRQFPDANFCAEVQEKKATLYEKLKNHERTLLKAPGFDALEQPLMLSEVLSFLWKRGAATAFHKFTPESWELRLASPLSGRDETWQDDRSDFKVLTFRLSLPGEGDYAPDFTLIQQRPAKLELYTRWVSSDLMPRFYSLYKRKPGCVFNWNTRQFEGGESIEPGLSYTMWMSDDPQERLMMWEAAKRSSGKVLCGGLGLGVFPQLALSLPGVQSVHVVEMEKGVIDMIQAGWSRNPWNRMDHSKITHQKIEDFLKTTTERFDTVYIDTWDAIYNEYLPHLNYLTQLCKKVLKPGGEILLWAFDRMVQDFLQTARDLDDRRRQYLAAVPQQLVDIQQQFPLLHQLVLWLRAHPDCSHADLQTQAYKIATRTQSDLGILKLGNQKGAEFLVLKKYS